jgi:hypothetical protein
MQAPYVIRWIASILLALPAPNASWASIIGDIAWPLTVTVLVFRFRKYLRNFLETLLDRLATDNVKTPWFEFSAKADVNNLDPASGSTDFNASGSDVANVEKLFEFIGANDGWDRLASWLFDNDLKDLPMEDFLTGPEYASQRNTAYNALIVEE